jgi:hypothetical protein
MQALSYYKNSGTPCPWRIDPFGDIWGNVNKKPAPMMKKKKKKNLPLFMFLLIRNWLVLDYFNGVKILKIYNCQFFGFLWWGQVYGPVLPAWIQCESSSLFIFGPAYQFDVTRVSFFQECHMCTKEEKIHLWPCISIWCHSSQFFQEYHICTKEEKS